MAETVISNFQAGHSWVKYGAPGTVSDDTSVYKFGTQSLKLVTDGAAGECKIRWTSISPAIDLTNRFFILWVRIDDMANLNRLWLYAYSTAWTAGYTWKPSDAPSHWLDSGGAPHGSNATWLPISLSFGSAVVAGAPNRAAITNFQLYAQDKNGVAVTINFGGLHMADIESNAGVVTFSFDDCWDSIYNEGYDYLSVHHSFPGVSYLAHEDVGAANRMTLANLQTMPAVKEYFRTCRTIIPYSETRPPGDLYNTEWPIADFQALVDYVIVLTETPDASTCEARQRAVPPMPAR